MKSSYQVRSQLTGQRFGMRVVLGFSHVDSRPQSFWRTRCDCGREQVVSGTGLQKNFRRGFQNSCGCMHFKHGMTGSREHKVWIGMMNRCHRPQDNGYRYYGARGITVCERWHDFNNFYMDMGERPPDRPTIERLDNYKGYSPDNCVWASWETQRANRRPKAAL